MTGKTLSSVVQNVVCRVRIAGKKEIVYFRFPTNLEIMERKQTDRQTDRQSAI